MLFFDTFLVISTKSNTHVPLRV